MHTMETGSPAHTASAHRRPRVLVADGDVECCGSVAAALHHDGFEVSTLADGADVLTAMERWTSSPQSLPDVVVIDYDLPHFSGAQALALLWLCHAPVRVVLLSRDGTLEALARSLGAVVVPGPPLDLDELRALVHGLASSAVH